MGKGRAAGWAAGRVRLFVSNRGSGRVNVLRVGSGPRKVTRGQLWFKNTNSDRICALGYMALYVHSLIYEYNFRKETQDILC